MGLLTKWMALEPNINLVVRKCNRMRNQWIDLVKLIEPAKYEMHAVYAYVLPPCRSFDIGLFADENNV